MSVTIRRLKCCRVCGASSVRRFLSLDDMPFMDGVVSSGEEGTEFLSPLDIYWCDRCRTVQTQHDVELTDYYAQYRYSVSGSPLMTRYMRLLAESSLKRGYFGSGDSVIEIGSADGSQLKCFQELGARVLGYEPSSELARASERVGVEVVEGLFTPESEQRIPQDRRPAQVMLLTYTLDHLPDPLGFLKAVASVLDPERGVLILEVHDLAKILVRREACLFAHEHSVYLSYETMGRLLARAGFRIIAADFVAEPLRRGNSLLVAAAHEKSLFPSCLPLPRVPGLNLDEWATYEQFSGDLARSIARFRSYVREGLGCGKRFAGYGAGGRAVMTLAMADLTRAEIPYICDLNPSLHGLIMPRSHVPIVNPEHLLQHPVDEVIVFPFGYMDEIRTQLGDYVRHGGKLVSLLDLLA